MGENGFEYKSSTKLLKLSTIKIESYRLIKHLLNDNKIQTVIVKPFDSSIVQLDQYHNPVLITEFVLINHNSHKCPKSWYYDYNKVNYNTLHVIFASLDWSIIYNIVDINVALNTFYEVILNAIDQIVPKTLIHSNSFPRWFSEELRNLIKN